MSAITEQEDDSRHGIEEVNLLAIRIIGGKSVGHVGIGHAFDFLEYIRFGEGHSSSPFRSLSNSPAHSASTRTLPKPSATACRPSLPSLRACSRLPSRRLQASANWCAPEGVMPQKRPDF